MKAWHGTTAMAIALAAVTAALSGCTTMGGNVKGSFACSAPAGVCSPTSRIDDQALAMISGGDGEATPSGLTDPGTRGTPGMIPVFANGRLVRSQEKVLRIVFPAHIDRLGQYREASAIHAVVERGEWMTAVSGPATAAVGINMTGAQFAAVDQATSLAELAAGSPEVAFADGASGGSDSATGVPVVPVALMADPQAPSAAAVAAARRAGKKRASRAVPTHPLILAAPSVTPAAQVSTIAVLPTATSYDLRNSARLSASSSAPLQSIRDQVGSIFAARGAGSVGSGAKPIGIERPFNGPSVLAVSGVGQ